jgi:acyl carrier protein
MQTIDTLNKIAARVFEVDEKTAAETEFLFDFEKWDSLMQLAFVQEVETTFGIQFDPDVVFQLFTKEDVIEAMEKMKSSC